MPDSLVVDASVAAKINFIEEGLEDAAAALQAAHRVIAPDLIYLEMASIAAKNVRRATASLERATRAVTSLDELIDEVVPSSRLATRAFELAAEHGVSAYDGAYLALAEARGLSVLTADIKLVRRARGVGLSHLVHALGDRD
jgi:predicted nucleic acid-binding protein